MACLQGAATLCDLGRGQGLRELVLERSPFASQRRQALVDLLQLFFERPCFFGLLLARLGIQFALFSRIP